MTLAPMLAQAFGFDVVALLTGVVDYAYYILFGFIIASILFSYIGYPSSGFGMAVYELVGNVVGPILGPIRSRIPALRLGGFALDLSPIIAIIGLGIARTLLNLIIENFIGPVVPTTG